MGWRDLIETAPTKALAPWLGGRTLHLGVRRWGIEGRLPAEHGWHVFLCRGRMASVAPVTSTGNRVLDGHASIISRVRGIPIGNRFVGDEEWLESGRRIDSDSLQDQLIEWAEPLHLLDAGIARFEAVYAGRAWPGGPLVYLEPALPDEAASDVQRAWDDGKRTLDGIRAVTPALDVAFRLLWLQRDVAERARLEIERQRIRALDRAGGTAFGRRELAGYDFERAARAALAAGGAELLDEHVGARPTERVVRFRSDGLRFECVCHGGTLQIIDSGICLADHATGRRDDALLTLESLPSVIREARRTGRLHVYRPVEPRHMYNAGDDWNEDAP